MNISLCRFFYQSESMEGVKLDVSPAEKTASEKRWVYLAAAGRRDDEVGGDVVIAKVLIARAAMAGLDFVLAL